jgi:hypothetical protein
VLAALSALPDTGFVPGKYRPLAPVLRKLILRSDTPPDSDVKDVIAGQLDSAEDRFVVMLDRYGALPQAFILREQAPARFRIGCIHG